MDDDLAIQKEHAIDTCSNLDKSWGNYVEWKKPISKGYKLYDSIYITILKWPIYRNRQVRDFQGLNRGVGVGREVAVAIKGQQ